MRPRLARLKTELALINRRGVVLLVLIYGLGWALGKSAGKIEVLERYAGPA